MSDSDSDGERTAPLTFAAATTPRKSPRVRAKVVVVAGPDEGLEVPLDERVEVGVDPGCQLVVSDRAVSRRHVAFERVAGAFLVKDLDSRNGTFMGGARVMHASVPLGAVLKLGNTSIAIHPCWYVREVAPSNNDRFGELVGQSLAMREVFAILERVAPSDVTVLIEGESGTGKELAARSLHNASHRDEQPYVVFDCGSVPRELAESELFGHRRGAFTGAVEHRVGAFQRADGGSICLDEIGELPSELQPALLRVLETGEVKPVGGDESQTVDVRVLASTNRDLGAEVRRGNFRNDLYYRLEVVKVRTPPLRSRPEDVPGLAAHLLQGRLAEGSAIAGENLQKLMAYSWPGNVRELRNVLDRAVALATSGGAAPRFDQLVFNLGPIEATPAAFATSNAFLHSDVDYKQAKDEVVAAFDHAFIASLLQRHGGNVTRAAAASGLSRKHLYELMRRTGVGG